MRGKSDPDILCWIAASVVAITAVNLNGIKTLLANGLNAFFIKGNSFFSNGPKSQPKNTTDCPILCNWDFDSFILAEEPFAKAFQSFETCVLVNNNLYEKPDH